MINGSCDLVLEKRICREFIVTQHLCDSVLRSIEQSGEVPVPVFNRMDDGGDFYDLSLDCFCAF